jgi:ribosomal protein S6
LNKYEAVCVLSDSLKVEALDGACAGLTAEIEKLGGHVTNEKRTGMRNLARPTTRARSGHWVELAFELEPDRVAPLRERFKLNELLLRVMIVRAKEGKAAEAAAVFKPE